MGEWQREPPRPCSQLLGLVWSRRTRWCRCARPAAAVSQGECQPAQPLGSCLAIAFTRRVTAAAKAGHPCRQLRRAGQGRVEEFVDEVIDALAAD
jgi:hypothetical protein